MYKIKETSSTSWSGLWIFGHRYKLNQYKGLSRDLLQSFKHLNRHYYIGTSLSETHCGWRRLTETSTLVRIFISLVHWFFNISFKYITYSSTFFGKFFTINLDMTTRLLQKRTCCLFSSKYKPEVSRVISLFHKQNR